MIIYKDILKKLKQSGYSTSRIRKEKLLSEGTLQRIRTGRPLTTETINTICFLTGEKIENLMEYQKDHNF